MKSRVCEHTTRIGEVAWRQSQRRITQMTTLTRIRSRTQSTLIHGSLRCTIICPCCSTCVRSRDGRRYCARSTWLRNAFRDSEKEAAEEKEGFFKRVVVDEKQFKDLGFLDSNGQRRRASLPARGLGMASSATDGVDASPFSPGVAGGASPGGTRR